MSTIDLSQLPAPLAVEALDYETLLAERKAELIALYPVDEQAAITRTLSLESEPLVKLLQENAYRELVLRQRVNEAAQAVMVAYANGSDLDQLGANNNVQRLIITPAAPDAIPPVIAVMESDTDFRLRIPQAFEALSVAGPTGAYEAHARSADGRVADASALSPSPACVTVTVLARAGNGEASPQLLDIVRLALNDEDVRPVADRVTVQSAAIVEYQIDAVLYIYPGPEAEPVCAAAQARLGEVPVPLRQLWSADLCPLPLLPYLAWAWSVDRWDESWPEATKRAVVKSSAYLHKRKGTIGALRRVVEPLGYLIRVIEWWKTNETPGTFRLDVGVLETGITNEMYFELERLIDGAKPCSRHLVGLSINLDVSGAIPVSVASYDGDELTVYPYLPETITVTGQHYTGGTLHLIDSVSVNP
ncbi:phage tail protein I [Yersinia bercovieri]|uniref:phage tail protein I n=1 Tax=Yersinia bercovieri TaxID=634 RepID=UPI003FD6F33F